MLMAVRSTVFVAGVTGVVLVSMVFAIVVRVGIVFVLVFVFVCHCASLPFRFSCAKLAQKRRLLQGISPALANFTRQSRTLLVK